MAKRVLWNRVCLSFHPSVLLSETFLGIGSLVCSETRMALEAHLVLCVTAGIFEKKHLPPKCRRWVKNKVFEFIGKIFHCFFFWLWSIKKVYTIYCIIAQIPYLEKIWFLRYGPKSSQPITIFKLTYLKMIKKVWFFCMLIQIRGS